MIKQTTNPRYVFPKYNLKKNLRARNPLPTVPDTLLPMQKAGTIPCTDM